MRRSYLETLYVILTLSINGVKKTRILYGANLSYSQLEKFLEMSITKELLIKKDDYYITTNKGQTFISDFQKIQSLIEEKSKKQETLQNARTTGNGISPLIHFQ